MIPTAPLGNLWGQHSISVGDPQGFIVRGRRNEKMKCDKCGWEGTRKAYGPHVKSIHGTKPKLTRCEKCGIKCYSLWLVSHKCSQQWPNKHYEAQSAVIIVATASTLPVERCDLCSQIHTLPHYPCLPHNIIPAS